MDGIPTMAVVFKFANNMQANAANVRFLARE